MKKMAEKIRSRKKCVEFVSHDNFFYQMLLSKVNLHLKNNRKQIKVNIDEKTEVLARLKPDLSYKKS